MQFLLAGFTQEGEFRVFAFDGISADHVRVRFTVRADLDLSRRYGIRLQELPLICRAFLEARDESVQQRAWTFTEEAMRMHADRTAARALASQNRKPPRKRASENNGIAWRSSPI